MSHETDQRYHRRDDVALVESEGRAVVLPLGSLGPDTKPLALTGTAHLIWGVCEGRTLDEICVEVARLVGMDTASIRDDISNFLDSLITAGVLEKGGPENP